VLFAIAFISERGNLHASLAVFILGILVSELMKEEEETDKRIRAVAFSIFVPAFYFKAGLLLSFNAVAQNILTIAMLLALAFATKFIGIYLVGRPFLKENTRYGATLMNARLTFGTIAATYGVTHGIIDQQYFSILISMIILASAVALVLSGKPPLPAEVDEA
jgi:Kef-type K+ transport system membrane component KefB